MAVSGIDVSTFQGVIDWKKVADAGIKFAMIRSGYSTTVDKRFEENYKGATAAGIGVGVYHFSYATSPARAKAEAEFVLSLIKDKKLAYPVAYDFEEESAQYVKSRGINVTKAFTTELASTFLSTVENAGYYVMLYSNLNCINLYFNMNTLRRYDLWYAQWASRPTYTGEFGIWQRSSSGRINGISGNVDLDTAYKDYPAIMREKSLNGFGKEHPTVTINETYKSGSKGIGVYILQATLKALDEKNVVPSSVSINGKYDSSTVSAVKALQKKAGLSQSGVFNQAAADELYKLLLTL